MVSHIQNLFRAVWKGREQCLFYWLSSLFCLLFSRKMFHWTPVAAQHGPEWPVSLRQVRKLPSPHGRIKHVLDTAAAQFSSGDQAENWFDWTSSLYHNPTWIFILFFASVSCLFPPRHKILGLLCKNPPFTKNTDSTLCNEALVDQLWKLMNSGRNVNCWLWISNAVFY